METRWARGRGRLCGGPWPWGGGGARHVLSGRRAVLARVSQTEIKASEPRTSSRLAAWPEAEPGAMGGGALRGGTGSGSPCRPAAFRPARVGSAARTLCLRCSRRLPPPGGTRVCTVGVVAAAVCPAAFQAPGARDTPTREAAQGAPSRGCPGTFPAPPRSGASGF